MELPFYNPYIYQITPKVPGIYKASFVDYFPTALKGRAKVIHQGSQVSDWNTWHPWHLCGIAKDKTFFPTWQSFKCAGTKPCLLFRLSGKVKQDSMITALGWTFTSSYIVQLLEMPRTVLHFRVGTVHKDFSGQHSLLELGPLGGGL